jgi:TolA-binding protein
MQDTTMTLKQIQREKELAEIIVERGNMIETLVTQINQMKGEYEALKVRINDLEYQLQEAKK